MAMTRVEKTAKQYLLRLLRSQGYPTYAKIFNEFEFNYTNDPTATAAVYENEGRIRMTVGMPAYIAAIVIRHELLHVILNHTRRLLKKLAIQRGLDPDELDAWSLEDIELHNQVWSDEANIVADYEISNVGYTERDKRLLHDVELNGRIVSFLVTEDEHPDWVNLSMEEMWDKLQEEKKKTPPKPPGTVPGIFKDPTTFVGMDGTVYGI